MVSEAGEASGARSETGDVSNPGELLDTLLERYPFGGVELGLLGRCGAALCDVLRGRVEGLELLFGVEGGGAESLYHEAPLLRAMNRQVGEVVSGLVGGVARAGRRLRVLEVGARTGGTTGAVLGALPAGGYEYTYTDISAGFFAGAEGRFGGEGASLVYRVLDIERDPVAQGVRGARVRRGGGGERAARDARPGGGVGSLPCVACAVWGAGVSGGVAVSGLAGPDVRVCWRGGGATGTGTARMGRWWARGYGAERWGRRGTGRCRWCRRGRVRRRGSSWRAGRRRWWSRRGCGCWRRTEGRRAVGWRRGWWRATSVWWWRGRTSRGRREGVADRRGAARG